MTSKFNKEGICLFLYTKMKVLQNIINGYWLKGMILIEHFICMAVSLWTLSCFLTEGNDTEQSGQKE